MVSPKVKKTIKFECVTCGELFDQLERFAMHKDSTGHDLFYANQF